MEMRLGEKNPFRVRLPSFSASEYFRIYNRQSQRKHLSKAPIVSAMPTTLAINPGLCWCPGRYFLAGPSCDLAFCNRLNFCYPSGRLNTTNCSLEPLTRTNRRTGRWSHPTAFFIPPLALDGEFHFELTLLTCIL